MEYLNFTLGKMIVHIGTVPGGKQEEFVQQRLSSVRGRNVNDVVFMHMPQQQHTEAVEGVTLWPAREGLWDYSVVKKILACNPRLVVIPQLSLPDLHEAEHAQFLENIVVLLEHGVAVETSLAMLQVVRMGDVLEPQVHWPEHAVLMGDYLRKNVGDYQLHDETPRETLTRYYRGEIAPLPEPLRDKPMNLFNLANLNRLREVMLRFVNSHLIDVARQSNPSQITLPVNTWMPMADLLRESLMALVANLVMITVVHALWRYAGMPFPAVGMLMLAAPVVTALYVNPLTSLFSAIVTFVAFSILFLPAPFTGLFEDPAQVMTMVTFLTVTLGISYLTNQQHVVHQQDQEQTTLLRALLRLVYDLNYAETVEAAVEAGVMNLHRTLSLQAVVVHPEGEIWMASQKAMHLTDADLQTAKQCMAQGSVIPPAHGSEWVWCPLNLRRTVLGALGIKVGLSAVGPLSWGALSVLRAYSDMMVTAMRRLQLREAGNVATQEAEREGLRAALLSAVSHDLKTPLVSIIGSLSTLRQVGDGLPEANRTELLVTASEEAERLHSIIHNVLELTRLESGHVQPRIAEIDLDGMVETLFNRCRRYYPKLSVVVTTPRPLPCVAADALLLEEVLYNLIDNAAKYAGTERPLEVGAVVEDETVRLMLANHGPGIAEDERERVFDKYFRSEQKDSRTAGSGLGLAISRAIIEACHGNIHVEGRPDGTPGTVVVIELPYVETSVTKEETTHE